MAECYSEIAMLLDDIKICDLAYYGWSNECYFNVAVATNNRSLCKKARRNSYGGDYTQWKCYLRTII